MHLFPLLCAVGVVDDVNFGVDEHIGSDSRVLESPRRSVSWPDMKGQAFRSRFQKLSRSLVCSKRREDHGESKSRESPRQTPCQSHAAGLSPYTAGVDATRFPMAETTEMTPSTVVIRQDIVLPSERAATLAKSATWRSARDNSTIIRLTVGVPAALFSQGRHPASVEGIQSTLQHTPGGAGGCGMS